MPPAGYFLHPKTEAKAMPPAGYSWVKSWPKERDWDVYNAEEWLVKGPPSHLSSQIITGFKASKKKFERTMQLEPIDFAPEMPAGLPFTVAERLKPLMTSMSSPLFVSGSYDQDWRDDVACVEVLISSFSITCDNNRKLKVLFYRMIWKYDCPNCFECDDTCHRGAMVLTCQFDSDKVHLLPQAEGKKKSKSKKEKDSIKTLLRVGLAEELSNTSASEENTRDVMTFLGMMGENGDPTTAQFVAFLLNLCYDVAEADDLEPAVWGISKGPWGLCSWKPALLASEHQFLVDIRSFCPDARELQQLDLVVAFLGGHHKRLGESSKILSLPDLPLQMIAEKFLQLPR